jgi:hypothetical protein
MPVAGNHEACGGCPANPVDPDSKGNFSEYRARMHSVAMHSNSGNNIFYSFERGLVHFLVFSAEAYLYARNAAFLANQLAFMKADLAGVDRARTPWVVALVHKDFTMEGEAFAAFAPILNAGGVDLLFCGHVCISDTLRMRSIPRRAAALALAAPPNFPAFTYRSHRRFVF